MVRSPLVKDGLLEFSGLKMGRGVLSREQGEIGLGGGGSYLCLGKSGYRICGCDYWFQEETGGVMSVRVFSRGWYRYVCLVSRCDWGFRSNCCCGFWGWEFGLETRPGSRYV